MWVNTVPWVSQKDLVFGQNSQLDDSEMLISFCIPHMLMTSFQAQLHIRVEFMGSVKHANQGDLAPNIRMPILEHRDISQAT
jgi:hypothetical protein